MKTSNENFGPAAVMAAGPPPRTKPTIYPPLFAARAVQGVYWNTFFTRSGEKDAKLNAKSNASYTLVLDLSAYNYSQIRATK